MLNFTRTEWTLDQRPTWPRLLTAASFTCSVWLRASRRRENLPWTLLWRGRVTSGTRALLQPGPGLLLWRMMYSTMGYSVTVLQVSTCSATLCSVSITSFTCEVMTGARAVPENITSVYYANVYLIAVL